MLTYSLEVIKPTRTTMMCNIHGETEALMNGGCKLCKEEKDKKEMIEQRKQITYRLKRNSGIPERFLDYTLANYPIDKEKQATLIKTMLSYDFKQNIVLLGKVGTGKTRIACSLIDSALQRSLSAYYAKYYQLTRMSIEDKGLFKIISNVDFLVIDEFGASDTDHKTQLLFELFDRRYDNMKATMLISNLSGKQIQEKIGDALYSRIKQDCISFMCDWEDYRLKI